MKKFAIVLVFGWLLVGHRCPAVESTNRPATFQIVLPTQAREFPEPLPPGAAPGFKIRGTKGWAWTPEQYLAEIPFIARCRMNFLMNCYLSMFDLEHHSWSERGANRWWETLPPVKKAAYEAVVRSAQAHGLQFCFSMNPNLFSARTVNDHSPENVDLLFKHYAWMQGLGVKWFNLALDDATNGIDAASQAEVCNEIYHRLKQRDSAAQMIFCPTYYWGDGSRPRQRPYLETLAKALDPEIYVFWTGDAVVGPITLPAAKKFRALVQHRVILWDNYPVNDGHPTMHLGPVTGRDPNLGKVLDGYVSNPLREENEINRIPLATCADYAYNPQAYDAGRSIGQAILLQADDAGQRQLLCELVETYPGMLLSPASGHKTSFNPVRARMQQLVADPAGTPAATAYVASIQNLEARFKQAFPNQYRPEKAALDADIAALKSQLPAPLP